jgi:hypothetical protein
MQFVSECKIGEYVECGNNNYYSKMLIITDDTCVIKSGILAGNTISLEEWVVLNADYVSSMRKSTKDRVNCNTAVYKRVSFREPEETEIEYQWVKPKYVMEEKPVKKSLPWYYSFVCGFKPFQ